VEITVESVATATEALEFIASRQPDIVILDLVLPDNSGLEVFHRIQEIDSTTPVIFLTAQGTSNTTIEAVQLGAFDYLVKPLDITRLQEAVAQALKVRRLRHVRGRPSESVHPNVGDDNLLIGNCPAMQEVYKAIGRVASQNVNVLIRGESGTGKELVARAIYQHSPRAAARFLEVNCAAIPETLLESELFGHEKGSFTGADAKRIGKFEQCSGGTLFLDEVGDMTPLMQSKVLRVLQDHRFERVGGNQTLETDVWIIAATNRDLEQMVAKGQFRSDLYYRLNGYTITLPPLRERGKDIAMLIEHFLARYKRELGKDVSEVAFETLDCLMHYSWPGNVRELQSVLKQAMLRLNGPILLPEFLPREILGPSSAADAIVGGDAPAAALDRFVAERLKAGSRGLYAEAVAYMERHVLTIVLSHTEGNQSHAAKILGITRGSLRSKIRTLGIKIDCRIRVDEDGESEPDELSTAVAGAEKD
jgi:two-component system nitrogen regulation response regulator GlnG